MSKIAIFTTLQNFDESYSLVSVIKHQARILKKYSNMEVEIWVLENCLNDYPEDLKDNVRKIVPSFHWINGKVTDAMVPVIQNVLQQGINRGIKYFICHDILLVSSYITYNEAIRRVAGINYGVKWFHWMHSGPHTRPAILGNRVEMLEHTMPCNSSLVYLNYFDLQRAANMYQDSVTANSYVVYNPVEQLDLSNINDPLALELNELTNFSDSSIRCIYPFSTTRMEHKQVKLVLEILHLIKMKGYSVKFIACNCHANALHEKDSIRYLIKLFTEGDYCLKKEDILFTSTYKQPKYEYSIPHSTIIDLFKLSNLFIFPSISEVCPLILQEAALTNNLIITNADFPSLMEITGPDGALFFQFGSIHHQTKYGATNSKQDRLDYLTWCVENIIPELNRGFYQTNAMFNVLHNYKYETIWNRQLKPMLNI